MCGIVGYIGRKNATNILVEGLKKLEYRGYDSAGIALLHQGDFQIVRSQGKIRDLEEKIPTQVPQGTLGIGHTRWATHGRPSEVNAHPHRSGSVVVVHNGIIENYQKLKKKLETQGHIFQSETDTEIICHLIDQEQASSKTTEEAFLKALEKIEGSYALAVLSSKDPNHIYVARLGSPLVIGIGEDENYVASDVAALLPYTRKVIFLEEGDIGILSKKEVTLKNAFGERVERPEKEILWDQAMAEKSGFKHFMLKEIFEQPRVIADTLAGRLDGRGLVLDDIEKILLDSQGKFSFSQFHIVACGTSYHAGMVGKYVIEELARLPVTVDLASEFRYRNPILDEKTLLLTMSQSGETADTLAAMSDAKNQGAKLLTICNVMESSMTRLADQTLYMRAGPEIGVASTKAFTSQMVVLLLIGLYLGQLQKKIDRDFLLQALEGLGHLSKQVAGLLKLDQKIAALARKFSDTKDFLYLGRGIQYPIALEGALKLKEISYIHAEGYAAGELKHGPIALIEEGTPVLVLAPRDKTYEKVLSNIEEVKARGARVIALAHEGDEAIQKICDDVILIPKSPWYLAPILFSIPLQLFAYHVADHKGTDVDQPRNLAKSVTVE